MITIFTYNSFCYDVVASMVWLRAITFIIFFVILRCIISKNFCMCTFSAVDYYVLMILLFSIIKNQIFLNKLLLLILLIFAFSLLLKYNKLLCIGVLVSKQDSVFSYSVFRNIFFFLYDPPKS